MHTPATRTAALIQAAKKGRDALTSLELVSLDAATGADRRRAEQLLAFDPEFDAIPAPRQPADDPAVVQVVENLAELTAAEVDADRHREFLDELAVDLHCTFSWGDLMADVFWRANDALVNGDREAGAFWSAAHVALAEYDDDVRQHTGDRL